MPLSRVQATVAPQEPGTPMLANPGFECSQGTTALQAAQGGVMHIPAGWTPVFLEGTPWLYSASMQFNRGSCGGPAHVEKIDGADSLAVFAHDLEWTDRPGKPFDVAVYQQVATVPGQAYSLSGWMLTLCGGSTMPNDCPEGFYMAKQIGLDPTGGTDPTAPTVVWVEDRRNFVEDGQRVGWVNLRVAATASAPQVTVFARIRSPFQWHGNHGFVDAFSLVNAPTAFLDPLPPQVDGEQITLRWHGELSRQIREIPDGTYRLLFDVQFRLGEDGAWQSLAQRQPAGQLTFVAQAEGVVHYFRVRPWAEQPPGSGGAWPNHRYPGVWSEPQAVVFRQGPPADHKVHLPIVER